MISILEAAIKYIAVGISVLPIRTDKSKAPALPRWDFLQCRCATNEELNTWFRVKIGVGAIGGAVSKNLEVYDFDDAAYFSQWEALIREYLGAAFFEKLLIVRTPRPGFHVYTRAAEIAGSQKLAMTAGGKTLIETKAEGGYVLLPGCPGECHETGKTYEVTQGSFECIPFLSKTEREVFLNCARSLNELIRVEPPEIHERASRNGKTPGNNYAAKTSWKELLEPHGYKPAGLRGSTQLWTRPGKEHGVSATTNYAGTDLFYPFSTNCAPFDNNRAYSKFAVLALLEYGGDFHQAALALYRRGYGEGRDKSDQPTGTAVEAEASDIVQPAALTQQVEQLYKTGLQPGSDPGWLSLRRHWTVRKGEWTVVTGIAAHGKTSVVNAIMMNLAKSEDWQWAVYSAESLPHELLIADLMEQYVRKPFNDGYRPRITPAECEAALKFIDAHFVFIAPPEEQETVERILACAQRLAAAQKLDGLVIDPWNELNHSWHERGLTETEYISRMLKLIRRFAAQWQVHVIVVAHPMKLVKDRSGNYPAPTPYDVSGSAHWRNKADCALCVWRDESRPGETTIFVQKVRRRFVGRIGRADLRYDSAAGTFTDWVREPGEDDE